MNKHALGFKRTTKDVLLETVGNKYHFMRGFAVASTLWGIVAVIVMKIIISQFS